MKSLIYIELTESLTTSYEKELITWAKATFPGLASFDLDNRSDVFMFNYAASLAEQSDKVVVYINIHGTASATQFARLGEKIIANKAKSLALMQGYNALVNRMFSLLNDNFCLGLKPEEQKKRIEDFFKD